MNLTYTIHTSSLLISLNMPDRLLSLLMAYAGKANEKLIGGQVASNQDNVSRCD